MIYSCLNFALLQKKITEMEIKRKKPIDYSILPYYCTTDEIMRKH